MTADSEKEEKLRESACIGDLEQMKKLIENDAININSQNSMNGWTALHWACKRNHVSVVKYLLSRGADKTIQNSNKEVPAQLTNTAEIRHILDYSGNLVEAKPLAIQPNYLKHPVFPYNNNQSDSSHQQPIPDPGWHSYNVMSNSSSTHLKSLPVELDGVYPEQWSKGVIVPIFKKGDTENASNYREVVLKARVAYAIERDFIEVEISRSHMTYENLVTVLTKELGVERHLVYKIRKLPDTIVRKDKDVRRLLDYQELEIVLTTKAMSAMSRSYGDVSDGFKHEQILY